MRNSRSASAGSWLLPLQIVPHFFANLDKQSNQSIRRQIRLHNRFRRARCSQNRFGSQISASHRAFHRGGPAGGGPISGQKHIRLIDVSCFGRQRSTPGCGENVAAASFITVAFTRSLPALLAAPVALPPGKDR